MLFHHIQFRHSARPKDFTPIRSPQLFVLRLTTSTLEFGYLDTHGEEAVMLVKGDNMPELVPHLIHDKIKMLEPGQPILSKPWVRIETIRKNHGFQKPDMSTPLAPDQTTVPGWLFCLDGGYERFYFGSDALEGFGTERGDTSLRMFWQFRRRFAFVFEVRESDYNNLLREMRDSNLDVGCKNRLSVFPDRYYVAGADLSRWKVQRLKLIRADLASQANWSPMLDFRPDFDSMTPEERTEWAKYELAVNRTASTGGGQDSSVSMD